MKSSGLSEVRTYVRDFIRHLQELQPPKATNSRQKASWNKINDARIESLQMVGQKIIEVENRE